MGYRYIEMRYNVIGLSSIAEFVGIRGGMNGSRQDVYFLRAVGAGDSFVTDVTDMDRELTRRMASGQAVYSRTGAFPRGIPMEEIQDYTACYDAWDGNGRGALYTKMLGEASGMGDTLGTACRKVLEIYRKDNAGISGSMERNFVSKLLYWTDTLAYIYMQQRDSGQSRKFVAQGIVKEQEYLFCYFLTLLGIDVLLLQNEKDIDRKLDALDLSSAITLGEKKAVALEAYDKNKYLQAGNGQMGDMRSRAAGTGQTPPVSQSSSGGAETDRPIRMTIPVRPGRRSSAPPQTGAPGSGFPTGGAGTASRPGRPARAGSSRTSAGYGRTGGSAPPYGGTSAGTGQTSGRELSFEELAQKASSVVMIALHNAGGEVVGTGSGIMIGRNGYILTNHHVASGGRFYSVRIENDEAVYKTDEIIKYNQVLDLAVIRINRELQPLPIYQGSRPLVRGQKVVAIGSPLGLFNSVSDGIISGFRNIRDVDMIQFTAPISSGSSGGAVLNMYGEVIGVSTAGFDNGQNINLAVGYEFIDTFTRGFRPP